MKRILAASVMASLCVAPALLAAETVDIGGLKVRADSPLARNEHPRLLLSRAELDRACERIRGPMAAEFQGLLKVGEKIEKDMKQAGGWPDPLIPAFLYALTGDKRHVQALRDGNRLLMKSSANHEELVLDLVWDALTPEEIKQMADEAAAGIAKKEWQYFRQYYAMSLLLYGTGHHDAVFAETIAKMHSYLKQEMTNLNDWADGRGGDVNCFGYIGNHSLLSFWPPLQAYSTALGEDLWPASAWSEYLAAYHVYHHRPDRDAMVHVDMAQHEDLKPHGGNGAFRSMELYWCKVPGVFKDSLTKWWVERYCYNTPRGLMGKILWPAAEVPSVPPDRFPPSRLFPTPGYAIMRSDWTGDAVYAHFRCGTWSNFSDGRHCGTNNTFCIYGKGGLAVNTGAHHGVVAGVLKFDDPKDPPKHNFEYGSLTIASNGVLVYYPNDPMRNAKRPNDGGQLFGAIGTWSKTRPVPPGPSAMGDAGLRAGTITAYENGPLFDYVCGDATCSYSPDSVESFTRQFVYIRPGTFVVFDRVTACKPEFAKTWVLHTHEKPVPNSPGAEEPDKRIHPEGHFTWSCDGGSATNKGGGRLVWKLLLPEKREIRLVGGPHHDFEAEGVNRGPTDASYSKEVAEKRAEFVELASLGGWRIEVEAKEQRAAETFLNVLQAVDSGTESMVPVARIDSAGRTGVRIVAGARTCEVTFAVAGATGGHIRITEGSKALLDRDLADKVQDDYRHWKDGPRYKEWMTNPNMRTVIGGAEQDAYGRQPGEKNP